MSIGEWFIVFVAICGVAFVPLMLIAVIVDSVWFQQERWTVWYPPDASNGFPGAWRRACNYWTARDYASIFKGTVFTEKQRRKMDENSETGTDPTLKTGD